MNLELLESAKARIPTVPILLNLASKRLKQLNAGMRPYVKPRSQEEDKLDIALREIAEGKLIAEADEEAIKEDQENQTKWSF